MRRTIGAGEGSSIFLLGLCGANLLSYLFVVILGKTGGFAGMSVSNWVGYAITQIAFIAVVAVYSALRRVDVQSVARIRKFTNWKQYILLPFIAIATILVFLPLSNLFIKFLNAVGFSGGMVSMPAFDNVGIYFLSLIIMALLPALGEELLVRGCLFNGLSTRSVWFGVLMSSLMFSLMHSNPLQTVHQFGLGAVLTIVLMLSGSIWSCVILHFLNNFISITIGAYIPQIDVWYASLGNWSYLTGAASVAVGAVMLACLLYLFYRAGESKREGYRVVTDGIVYEEFSIYATAETRKEDRKYKFRNSVFVAMWKFAGSLFTKRGWVAVTRELEYKNNVAPLGKKQPMLSFWLAIGFVSVYWLAMFISGLV